MPAEATFISLVQTAAQALKNKADEINRLNVFPVPDGDTGTNMSLTMDAVIAELSALDPQASVQDICHAITQGSLMGARGNSGVILSQMIRGVCDVVAQADSFDTDLLVKALANSKTVAFQAVRKPVEGTMLTVLKDCSEAASKAAKEEMPLDQMLEHVVRVAFDSVRRTPDLLPVLKENDVVDAGAYGLAVLLEGLLAAYKGEGVTGLEALPLGTPDIDMTVGDHDDWDDQEYLYCTEFLLFGEDLDIDSIKEFVVSQGGSELVVGSSDTLKIHVHTNEPGMVLTYMTEIGEVGEVHIHNMRKQTAERRASIQKDAAAPQEPAKPYGFVAVASGEGLTQILESLGVDVVVSGGQTMNPSTAQLAEAARSVNAENVVFLPNNKNIIMAAQQAAELLGEHAYVVPTTAVPEAFAALLAFDEEMDPDANVAEMTDAAASVRTGEVTTAIKDSQADIGSIRKGQVIGIADHEIVVAGDDVQSVTLQLADTLVDHASILTVLAGKDLDDEAFDSLLDSLSESHPDLEIDAHRGDQPLYPVILAAE